MLSMGLSASLNLEQRITTLWEAEQHVYSIPEAGVMCSEGWAVLTTDRRVSLRTHAVAIWKYYLENEGAITAHPVIHLPEYRLMLSHPDGELIVEEVE